MGRAVAGQTKTFGIELGSVANAGKFQVNPTLDAADFRISINGGAFTALTNTPTVSPAGGAQVVVVLAAAETTSAGAGGRIHLRCSDSSGGEWQDLAIDIDVFATAEDTLVATVTNLTNAPTNGDLTATMKTSVTTAATAATPTAAAVTGAVGSVTAGVTLADGAITATKIATDAIDADALAADAVTEIQSGLPAAVWAYVVEGALTAVQAYRIMLSVLAGKSAGGGTTTVSFRDMADSKNRVDATVDVDGNRTAVSRDPS